MLLILGIKLFVEKEKDIQLAENKVLLFCRKHFPKMKDWVVILIIVEITDLLFALDSIPAIFAITKDPFIVWTSNVFAIIGLRAMYFALAGIMPLFTYLHYALGAILVFIGSSMLLEHVLHVPTGIKLAFIASVLILAVVLSIKANKDKLAKSI
jgi:tellurite resistance protein TerC